MRLTSPHTHACRTHGVGVAPSGSVGLLVSSRMLGLNCGTARGPRLRVMRAGRGRARFKPRALFDEMEVPNRAGSGAQRQGRRKRRPSAARNLLGHFAPAVPALIRRRSPTCSAQEQLGKLRVCAADQGSGCRRESSLPQARVASMATASAHWRASLPPAEPRSIITAMIAISSVSINLYGGLLTERKRADLAKQVRTRF
jgi:hypothetical protein